MVMFRLTLKRLMSEKSGKTTVVYTVETLDSYGATASKTFEQEFEVVDKAAPVIELTNEEVSFYTGLSFRRAIISHLLKTRSMGSC